MCPECGDINWNDTLRKARDLHLSTLKLCASFLSFELNSIGMSLFQESLLSIFERQNVSRNSTRLERSRLPLLLQHAVFIIEDSENYQLDQNSVQLETLLYIASHKGACDLVNSLVHGTCSFHILLPFPNVTFSKKSSVVYKNQHVVALIETRNEKFWLG